MSTVARQRHILVVNDTVEILDLFREILEEEGYRVSLFSAISTRSRRTGRT